MLSIVAVLLALLPVIPAVIQFRRERKQKNLQGAVRSLVFGMNGVNLILGLMALGAGIVWLAAPDTVQAAGMSQAAGGTIDTFASLAAAISVGMACIGAGIAVSSTGAAAIGALAEKPETFGRSLIFVGLGEGIAIYGLIISFLVLNR